MKAFLRIYSVWSLSIPSRSGHFRSTGVILVKRRSTSASSKISMSKPMYGKDVDAFLKRRRMI